MSEETKKTAAAPETVPADEPAKKAEPDYYDQLLRLKAEFENYRKRVDRDRPEWIKLGRAGVLAKLLPLHDLLQRVHDEIKSGHADTPLVGGMDAVFKEFEKMFKDEGIVRVDPIGKPFDPHYHEALGVMDKPGCEEGAVAEVLEAGFLLGDKVLRTAKVRLQKKSTSV